METDGGTGRGRALAGAAVALGLVASTALAGHLALRWRADGRAISVKGFAERPITSDLAAWGVEVIARAPSLAEGWAGIERARGRVRDFLAGAGLPDDAVAVEAAAIHVQYARNERGHRTNEIERYELRQRITASSRDVWRIRGVAREVTRLIGEGVELRSEPPRFYYTELDRLKVEMLGEASRDARTRAGRIAAEGGAVLGPLRAARQGVFQITPVTSTEVSAGGMYDTSAVRKKVRAVITATFRLAS